MINPFPEDWELLSVFECEPSVGDAGYYLFDSQRGADRIRCEIWSYEGSLEFEWWSNDVLRLHFDLKWIEKLAIETMHGCDAITLEFSQDYLAPMRLQLKPTVCASWATTWN